ncbi:MAG: nucleotidyltransferase domain-containing protein [Anaerotignaceae bacterium]
MEKIYEDIKYLGQKYSADKIVLFGSRARGDHKQRSDIDLAVYEMPQEKQPLFYWDIEEIPTLLKFDIVHITKDTDKVLIENIEKDGIVLYEKDR